jgi:hypothetical protein
VDRFIRNRPGAPNPICWVPGLLSARYMALARDEGPPTARALRERQDRVYATPQLEHLLATNQFFINLVPTLSEGDRAVAVSVLTKILAAWWLRHQTVDGGPDA